MSHAYLVRYGVMRRIGRFDAGAAGRLDRGQAVVLRSHRGTELGEVLAPAADDPPGLPPILRPAVADDLERDRLARLDRPRRLALCEQVFRDGVWPLELIDVEPLLDDRRTVLHYLGPHRLDAAGLLEALRASCGLDILLEPAGLDAADDSDSPSPEADHGCGSCGSSGGGCGTDSGGCGTGGGCSGCAVKDLVARKRPQAAPTG